MGACVPAVSRDYIGEEADAPAARRGCAARHESAPTSSGMKNVAMKDRMTPLSSDADDLVQEFDKVFENFMPIQGNSKRIPDASLVKYSIQRYLCT